MINFTNAFKIYTKVTKEFFDRKKKEDIKYNSQYFTPSEEVEKMIDDLEISEYETVRILDPSCGNGILVFKLLEKIFSNYSPKNLIIDFYDIDNELLNNVQTIMKAINFQETNTQIRYINESFLENYDTQKYNYIIMNPPYKKINIGKAPEKLEKFLYGQPNLYHLFIALALDKLMENGILCVISPKNYLSGKYTEKLRQYIVNNFSIIKIHTFNDRKTLFGNNITQEVCITHIKKSIQEKVIISYNNNPKFEVDIDKIMINNDTKIIFTPRNISDYLLIEKFQKFPIATIGKNILMKTGKVVQFRIINKEINLKNEKFSDFENGFPLIVYRHINKNRLIYEPLLNKKKNKAITLIDDNLNNSVLIKNSNYIFIRKNIDKKYDKLIHSIIYLQELETEKVAVDNGIAYLTNKNDSLTEKEVLGLQCIIMSKQFDDYYRMINSSHTINIYELENIHFPDLETIREIGENIIINSLTIENSTEIFKKYLDG